MRVSIVAFAAAGLLSQLSQAAYAQTVQLPTFSFFSVSTTVSVPDNGGAFMGGINRASTGRNEFGVPGLAFPGFQNRSIGQDMSASNVWATATIHDFEAMDQAILNSPSPNDFANAGTSRWNTNLNLPAVPRQRPPFNSTRSTWPAIGERNPPQRPRAMSPSRRPIAMLVERPAPPRPTAISPRPSRPRPKASGAWPRSTIKWPLAVPAATSSSRCRPGSTPSTAALPRWRTTRIDGASSTAVRALSVRNGYPRPVHR